MTVASQPRTRPRVGDEHAIALLEEIVSIPSLSTAERPCVDRLVSRMQCLGLRSFVDESGSAIGLIGDETPDATEIALLGHIDTVPGDIPVRREGDLLFGRGTVDAKGPLIAFAVAAARADLPAGVRLRVIGAVEEEAATSKGARFAAAHYHPRACIIGEPSGLCGITLGYKGRLIARVGIQTDSSHSAGPEPTAAELAVGLWNQIDGWCRQHSADKPGAFDHIQGRLRAIRSTSDGLHDRVEMTLGFRLPPGVEPRQIEQACRRFADIGHGALVHWEFSGQEVAHMADRNNPVARAIANALRAQGHTPVPKRKTGTSDMNVVGPIWNCPIVAYGPGDSSLDHTPNEHVSVNEFLSSIRVLTSALELLARELLAQPH
ncbi:MAG: [LysW]-lysine hydrolase [Phycisphaerales bacterium]